MVVLCYHAVDGAWDSALAVDPESFEQQCQWLSRHGGGGRDASGNAAQPVVTFDDGFASVLYHALPSLRRHGLSATVFIVAGTLVDPPHPVDWLYAEDSDGYLPLTMSVDQMLELIDAGISIGSHSWQHRDLTALGEAECAKDLRESRELLEDLVAAPVPQLAYPYGAHAPHVRRAAERAGFDLAYALPEGPEESGRFAVPRTGVFRGNTMSTFRLKCSRVYAPLRLSRAYAQARRGYRGLRSSSSS